MRILIAVLVVGLLGLSSMYTLREGEQAIITQFGAPLGEPVTAAGLHFHIPVFHKIRRLEKRILNWDGDPRQIPTAGKKYIKVDTTARWRIVDPLKFIQTLQNEQEARTRLDTILDGEVRKVISAHRLVEAVRSTNEILETKEVDEDSQVEEEVVTNLEQVQLGREQLSQKILENAKGLLLPMGIELIDVQLKRISYESSVEQKVYERMISERKRIAEKIRSIGRGETARIQGKVSKELQRIESEAYKKAQEIKGEADAKAIKIYADAFNADTRFYRFIRTLEAYRNGIQADSRLVLSTKSAFLELMRNASVRARGRE